MSVRILDAVHSASWAMGEDALSNLIEVASRDHDPSPEALEAYRAEALARAERATVRDGVAILSVEGPLFKRANLMTEFCGATSYDVLRRDLQVAIDNPAVRAILLNIDSPGGEAAGTGELAAAIRGFRGVKPIVAFAGDLAASAAYWIASAADWFVIGAGAELGSIGVRTTYSDASARDEKTGVRRYVFVSSQSPFKNADFASDEGRARIQARVDGLAQVFVETVADNRGRSVEHVLSSFGKGDVLLGAAAVEAGMADAIGTFEGTLAALAAGNTRPEGGRTNAATAAHHEEETMTEAEIQARIDAALAAAATTAAAAQADAVAAATAAATTAATDAANTAERERVAKLNELTIAGYETQRDEAIRSGSTPGEFAALIVAAEKGKGATRAAAIEEDQERNADVQPGKDSQKAKGDDAAATAILSSMRLVTGKN